MEPVAIQRYVEARGLHDTDVSVQSTDLHIHERYPFVAASPDGIVREPIGTGLLEVKCPFSQKGMTPEDACAEKKFCFELVGNEVRLKKSQPYYFQVQGLLAITGHKWCDFVVYTAHSVPGPDLTVERIYFDGKFWEEIMLPALVYFHEWAVVPELLSRRVERLGSLHAAGVGHVPFQRYRNGYFSNHVVDSSLKMVVRRVK